MPDSTPTMQRGGESGRRAQYLLDILGTTDRLPPSLPCYTMLTYHPKAALYVAGTLDQGTISIDKDSQAYSYCEYLRTNFGANKSTDKDGDDYYIVNVPEHRVAHIRTFVGLEYTMQYLMHKGL